jgi:serine/threonine protein kinase
VDANIWRAAKPILDEALQHPANERQAVLEARCPDSELRRELQAYLNEYDEHFLETVLSVSERLGTDPQGTGTQQAPAIQTGDRIGPYVVVDRLGAGGMGHVFLADDTRLHRKVAVKCLTAWTSGGELRSRMLHEARAAAGITHPNIAIVYDVVEHEDQPLLIMEYVEGESLAAQIKRERPSIDQIVVYIRQLASALAAAHGKGIVHRDLKPANIQVTPDGSVKILDFGVAHAMSAASIAKPGKPASATSTAGAGLTVTVSMNTLQADRLVMHPGTPAYMSPEQMFGRPIDQRSDIYSLGVIVYELATGHRPYATDDPLELVLTLSRDFLKSGESAKPLPAQLNDIVSKMLAVRPDDRYQTAGELENALVALTASRADRISAPVLSRGRMAMRAAAGAVIVLASVTALGYLATGAFDKTLGRSAAFANESWRVWLEFGIRGLVLPTVIVIAMFMALAAGRFAVRVLSLSRGIEHLVTSGATRTAQLGTRLKLDDPIVLGQAVAALGVVLLGAVIWFFYPFVLAWMSTTSISTQVAGRFYPLQPVGRPRLNAQLYVIALSVLLFFFGAAIARIQRLRARQSLRQGGAALAVVVTLAVVTVILCEWPYRIEWQNKMPRLDVAGERCYRTGEHLEDLLVYCPERTPPRNRIVKRGDPDVRDVGVSENIFTPPEISQH